MCLRSRGANDFNVSGVAARRTPVAVVRSMLMSIVKPCVLAAVSAAAALLGIGLPSAGAVPDSDAQGYVNSSARCATADATVVFGSTDASRVAICKTPGGGFEYRGVRVRDGAKLVVPAKQSGDGTFVAKSDGVEYVVTAKSLVLSEGNKVIREEQMVDFHGQQAPAPAPAPAQAPAPATPTPTTPLPPPLPAEKGGGG